MFAKLAVEEQSVQIEVKEASQEERRQNLSMRNEVFKRECKSHRKK